VGESGPSGHSPSLRTASHHPHRPPGSGSHILSVRDPGIGVDGLGPHNLKVGQRGGQLGQGGEVVGIAAGPCEAI